MLVSVNHIASVAIHVPLVIISANVMSPRHCGALDRRFNGVGAVDIHDLFGFLNSWPHVLHEPTIGSLAVWKIAAQE
jgi:hypothetical protein